MERGRKREREREGRYPVGSDVLENISRLFVRVVSTAYRQTYIVGPFGLSRFVQQLAHVVHDGTRG